MFPPSRVPSVKDWLCRIIGCRTAASSILRPVAWLPFRLQSRSAKSQVAPFPPRVTLSYQRGNWCSLAATGKQDKHSLTSEAGNPNQRATILPALASFGTDGAQWTNAGRQRVTQRGSAARCLSTRQVGQSIR